MMANSPLLTGAPASPDTRSMLVHLDWLARPARGVAPSLRVEIAFGAPDVGPNRSRSYGIGELGAAVSFASWSNRKGWNVYVGTTLKSADAPPKGRFGADMAALATCLPVDIDNDFAATATKLATIAKPGLLVLTGRQPESRAQLFVRITPTADLAAWETAQKRLIRCCGGDENATGRGRLMRLAGSVSYPSLAKVERGYVVERTGAYLRPAPEYSISDLFGALPVHPAQAAPEMPCANSASCLPRRAKPPLSAVEAALRALPDVYARTWHLWIRVGFALHDFDSGSLGLSLWERFSQRCPQAAAMTDFAKLWQGFGRPYAGHRITTSWLQREALQASFGA